jgi:hypothetical protein
MKQDGEHGKKRVANRFLSFILVLVFVFSIFSGMISAEEVPKENNSLISAEETGVSIFSGITSAGEILVEKDSFILSEEKGVGIFSKPALVLKKSEKQKEGMTVEIKLVPEIIICILTAGILACAVVTVYNEYYNPKRDKKTITRTDSKHCERDTRKRCYEKCQHTGGRTLISDETTHEDTSSSTKKVVSDPITINNKSMICSKEFSGTICSFTSVSHVITLDPTASFVMFSLSWIGNENDLDLFLRSPNGTTINQSTAENNSNIEYNEGRISNIGYYTDYLINNPEHGNWIMNIAAKDVSPRGRDYYVAVHLESNITISLDTIKDVYNQNEPTNLIATLQSNNIPLVGALVTAEITRPNDVVDNLLLFDDGSHGDAQANDGNYSGIYTNTSMGGFYYIVVHASGTTQDGVTFNRSASKLVTVDVKKAKFTDTYYDYGTDVNNNGLYDYLTVDIVVNVTTAGNYRINGQLSDVNGSVMFLSSTDAHLGVRDQSIALKFDGMQICRHEIDAPYNYDLIISDEDDNLCDYKYDITTSAYNYTDFEKSSIDIIGNYSDCGTDTDGNGLYNYLTINVDINVSTAGIYNLKGDLYTSNGNYIGSAINYTYLNPGIHTSQLNFEGQAIERHGVNGSYYLKELFIRENEHPLDYRHEVYKTGAYNYTDFEAPLAEFTGDYIDYGIDFDGDGLYDYLTIDVGVNVITAGNYSVLGWLYDANGSEIVWSIDYGSLDVGNHTMHLDFDGKTIQMHGVNGPYYLKDLMLWGENWTFVDSIRDAYNTSAYNYSDFVDPVSTENEVTISGVGLGEISLIVSFTDTIPVFAGRYSYDLVGINVPQRPNNFTITTSEVKNLKVGVKKIQDNTTRIWVTQTTAAPEGIATVQSDWPSPGNYHVKIFGDAAEGVSEVDLELTAVKKITASGDFSLSIDISGFPAGKYTVTATADTGCFTDLTLEGLPLVP